MTVWSPDILVRLLSPSRRAVQKMARRWGIALDRDPELVADLIRMGGLLHTPTRNGRIDERGQAIGIYDVVPLDPYAAAVAAGRRELALELLALAKVSPEKLTTHLEDENDV